MDLFVYILIGALSGLLAGLFGVGGGLIVVPALAMHFAMLGFPKETLMHVTVGSSLGAMIFTTLSSAVSHFQKSREILPLFLKYAPSIGLGTLLGAYIADMLSSETLSKAFGIFVLLISYTYIKESKSPWPKEKTPYLVNIFTLFGIGTLSSMLGIGAGTMGLPFFNRFEKVPMHIAIGACSALSFSISIFGTLSYLWTGLGASHLPNDTIGYLYWPAILGINLSSPFFAWLGTKWAHQLSSTHLKRYFGILLIFVAAKMLF